MTLVDQPVNVGDLVQVTSRDRYSRAGGYGEYGVIDPSQTLRVTRVYTHSLIVRRDSIAESFNIRRVYLTMLEPADPNAPQPRRLGKKPDDTEEMTYIDTDDPRIQWLFEDMGRYATEQNYCSQYDALVARLGIPGRPRDFTVVKTINGITLTTTVRARTQREANEIVANVLGIVPQTEGTTEEEANEG